MNHQVTSYDSEAPSNLDLFVGMISKTADEQQVGWIQSISIRMPMVLGCTFEALAQYSGKSRNRLMVKALEAAVDLLFEQMSEEEVKEVEDLRSKILGQRLGEVELNKTVAENGEV